ncbi:hypothetical protein [Treponema primitia]|nr:hypothetical protein [Treponema primitia]
MKIAVFYKLPENPSREIRWDIETGESEKRRWGRGSPTAGCL